MVYLGLPIKNGDGFHGELLVITRDSRQAKQKLPVLYPRVRWFLHMRPKQMIANQPFLWLPSKSRKDTHHTSINSFAAFDSVPRQQCQDSKILISIGPRVIQTSLPSDKSVLFWSLAHEFRIHEVFQNPCCWWHNHWVWLEIWCFSAWLFQFPFALTGQVELLGEAAMKNIATTMGV